MTWEWMLIVLAAFGCAAGLVAWRWWLIHDSEPIEEDTEKE